MDQITYEEVLNDMKKSIGDYVYNITLQNVYIKKYESRIRELEQEITQLKASNPTGKKGKE